MQYDGLHASYSIQYASKRYAVCRVVGSKRHAVCWVVWSKCYAVCTACVHWPVLYAVKYAERLFPYKCPAWGSPVPAVISQSITISQCYSLMVISQFHTVLHCNSIRLLQCHDGIITVSYYRNDIKVACQPITDILLLDKFPVWSNGCQYMGPCKTHFIYLLNFLIANLFIYWPTVQPEKKLDSFLMILILNLQ